ncbi:MAG: acetyl-CoA carboxylase carboxyl transferase subunit beta, partial [Alphaproteobacteria bacterium]|nr:acetyl-CoA carboxylase carboxyl transferase subunit beta [Alphaproteobacteria bacterium]
MNWLTNFVRPKIRALVGRQKEIPDNLWEKCPGCSAMLFKRELEEQMNVCRHCGHHLRLDPVKRLEMLFDDGKYALIDIPKVTPDPLHFRDQKRYTDRLKDARAKTGLQDAVKVGIGRLEGQMVTIAVQDFDFMGGSLGMAAGEAFITAAQLALARKSSFVVCTASGGAR